MLRNWDFLLGEIWGLLALAALLGLFAGWLIWNRSKELLALRSDLETRDRDLKNARAEIEDQSRAFEAERHSWAEDRDVTRAEIEHLDARNEALEAALASEKAAAVKFERGYAEAKTAQTEAQRQLDHTTSRFADLEQTLASSRQRESQLVRFKEDHDAAMAARTKAQNEQAQEIARARRLDLELTKLKTDFHSVQTDAQRASALEAELQPMRLRAEKADRLEAEIGELRDRANRASLLETQVAEMTSKVQKADGVEAEIGPLRETAERAKLLEGELAQVKGKAEQADALERKLTAMSQKAALVAGLQDDVAAKGKQITQLEKQVELGNASRSELAGLRADIISRDKTIAELRARMAPGTDVVAPSNTPDYDGDGIREGRNEGTKPTTLQAARNGTPDDLKMIKGVGPKLEKMLHGLGFFHFDQVASWTADEVAWVDANLEGFNGRVSRDRWIAQAKVLAAGGETEFSARAEEDGLYRSA